MIDFEKKNQFRKFAIEVVIEHCCKQDFVTIRVFLTDILECRITRVDFR